LVHTWTDIEILDGGVEDSAFPAVLRWKETGELAQLRPEETEETRL
jgi:hypothetical protein